MKPYIIKGVCVPNFSFLSFWVWSGDEAQISILTAQTANIRNSLTLASWGFDYSYKCNRRTKNLPGIYTGMRRILLNLRGTMRVLDPVLIQGHRTRYIQAQVFQSSCLFPAHKLYLILNGRMFFPSPQKFAVLAIPWLH